MLRFHYRHKLISDRIIASLSDYARDALTPEEENVIKGIAIAYDYNPALGRFLEKNFRNHLINLEPLPEELCDEISR